MNNGAQVVAVFALIAFGGTATLMLVRAFAHRIAGRGTDNRELQGIKDELDQLRAEHDDMRTRLGQVDEIQSRLDFAERVLAQSRGKDALPGPR